MGHIVDLGVGFVSGGAIALLWAHYHLTAKVETALKSFEAKLSAVTGTAKADAGVLGGAVKKVF